MKKKAPCNFYTEENKHNPAKYNKKTKYYTKLWRNKMKSFPANLTLTIKIFAILFISFYSLSCAFSIKDSPGPEKKHAIYGMKYFTKQNS